MRVLVSACYSICLLFALVSLSAAQETNFAVGPQYLLTGSSLFARPIATPSLSLGAPLPEPPTAITNSAPTEQVTFENVSEVEGAVNLPQIYYGSPATSVVEVSFPSSTNFGSLPASIVETGVGEVTDAETLRIRGYGITLGEYARYWKAHCSSAHRHFTNEDIERLHKMS